MPAFTKDQMKNFESEDMETIIDSIDTLEIDYGPNHITEGTEVRTVKNNSDGSYEMNVVRTDGIVKIGHLKMLCGREKEILHGIDFLTALVVKRDAKDGMITVYSDLCSPVKIEGHGCQRNMPRKSLFFYRWNGSLYGHTDIDYNGTVKFQNVSISIAMEKLPVVSELTVNENIILRFSE